MAGNPGLLLSIGGAAAIIAAPFTGGASLYVYAAGFALATAGAVITAQAATPDQVSGTARRLGTTADPEAPWEWVYGQVVKGGHVAWATVAGKRDQLTGIDFVVACHPCEEILEIQLGDWFFTLTTNPAGVTSQRTKGLTPNGPRTVGGNPGSFTAFPSDWYVPGEDSPWVRSDQTENGHRDVQDEAGGTKKAHIACKIYYGDQTATDSHMAAVFGTDYSSVARKFTGHTVIHFILRGHTQLGTLADIPDIKVRVKGKNDLALNDSGSSTGYSANAAAVLADFMREQIGIAPAEVLNHSGSGLASLITECADTTWHSLGNAARYEFHGVIRDDVDLVDACNLIASHMPGGYSERGDKVVFWTGTIKSPWSDGPLGVDDFRGPVQTEQPNEDAWVNLLVPHFVPQLTTDEDGNTHLYGSMEPTGRVGSGTYVTEDGGVQLVKDVKFEGCNLSRRAVFMARCALDQLRLGAQYTRRFSKRAIVLEVGDVYEIEDPERLSGPTKFRLVHKSAPDPVNFTVELTGQRYEDAIYTSATVSEDALGVIPALRTGILPVPENLSVAIVGSGRVGADGRMTVDVLFTWDDPDDVLVLSAGGLEIEWKLSTEDWPGRSVTTGGGALSKVIPGLLDGESYDARARFFGSQTGGRTDRPIGDWTEPDMTFAVSLAAGGIFRPLGPPLGAIDGVNLLTDPYVTWRYSSDEGDGIKLGGFAITNADGSGNTPTGRVYTVSGVGYWTVLRNGVATLTAVEMTVNGDAGDSVRFNVLEYLRVVPGQILQVGASVEFASTGQLECRVLFYDSMQSFLASALAFSKSTGQFGAGEWFHLAAPVVVRDGDVGFARLQFRQVQTTSHSTPPTAAGLVARWKFDGDAFDSANGFDGTVIGSPSYVTGTINQAISLDGASQYVDFGDQDALLADGYSYSLWVSADGTTGQRGIISKLQNVSPFDGFLVEQNGADLRIYIDGATPKLTVSGFFADTSLHHLAVTLDAGTVRVYKAGSQVATASYTTVTNPPGVPFLLGRQNNLARYLDGKLDDVRVYDDVLTPTEVSDLASLAAPSGQVPEVIAIDGMLVKVLNRIDRLYDPNETWTIGSTNWTAVASIGQPVVGSVDIGGTGYLAGGDGFWCNGTMSAIFTVSAEVHTQRISTGTVSADTFAEFSLILIDATHPHWMPSTVYAIGDKVRAHGFAEPERVYVCDVAGTSASSGNGPSGNGTNITDGTARWDYDSDVTVTQLGPTAVKKKSKMASGTGTGVVNEDVVIRYHTRSGPDLLGEGARIARLRCRLTTTGDTTRVQAIVSDIRFSAEFDFGDVEAAA